MDVKVRRAGATATKLIATINYNSGNDQITLCFRDEIRCQCQRVRDIFCNASLYLLRYMQRDTLTACLRIYHIRARQLRNAPGRRPGQQERKCY